MKKEEKKRKLGRKVVVGGQVRIIDDYNGPWHTIISKQTGVVNPVRENELDLMCRGRFVLWFEWIMTRW